MTEWSRIYPGIFYRPPRVVPVAQEESGHWREGRLSRTPERSLNRSRRYSRRVLFLPCPSPPRILGPRRSLETSAKDRHTGTQAPFVDLGAKGGHLRLEDPTTLLLPLTSPTDLVPDPTPVSTPRSDGLGLVHPRRRSGRGVGVPPR